MTDVVVIREPQTVVHVVEEYVRVDVVSPGPQGPPGPPCTISRDAGNAITHGSDAGLYCPAVVTSTMEW